MPIQFRSRIPGMIIPTFQDQQGSISIGWCCGLNTSTSFYQCKETNNYWIRGASNGAYCPNQGTSCLESGELNTTPGACCHWIRSGTEDFENVCANVQNEQECKNLHKATAINYNYWPGITCYSPSNPTTIPQQICNGVKLFPSNTGACNDEYNLRNGANEQCFNWDDQWGNCCSQPNIDNPASITSTTKTRSDCSDGFWTKNSYNRLNEKKIKRIGVSSFCTQAAVFAFEKTGDYKIFIPPIIDYTEFIDPTTDPIKKQPSPGTIYQGGIFVGVFDKASGTDVKGVQRGEESQGIQEYKSTPNASTYQSRPNKWALIIAPEDTEISGVGAQIQYHNTSITSRTFIPDTLSDGILGSFNDGENYNALLDLPKKLPYTKINGFSDWYIPSKEEWDFFFKQNIDTDIILSNKQYQKYEYKKLKQGNYWSSTAVDNIDNISYNYSFSTYPTYGYTNITPITSKIYLRLFRRIYLL